ncbi:MAG: redox-regulated ATPase YchF [Verrucomicrobia bacterium]|nr:redox-regulated ATPase YchF [Verrucomicrobiota bacterium]
MTKLACGIVGLPNVGKSTLFNALTAHQAEAKNYPFCTIDPNVGLVEVPDERLAILSKLSSSKKIIPAVIEFVDIAGLVRGASKGEGLGNKFLINIRETDAICHVVRCFENDDVIHVEGKVDPISDIETIELELTLADLQMAENAMGKVERQAKNNKELQVVFGALKKAVNHLSQGLPMRTLALGEEELKGLKAYPFLTEKKVLYVCNVSEQDLPGMENPLVKLVREYATRQGNAVIPICAKVEEEISQLSETERGPFLEVVGLSEPGLHRLIRAAFEMLGLISFLTTGEMETRAWTIPRGTTAPEAAGQIHTDIQKGFIRAEVVSFKDMVAYQGRVGAKEAGCVQTKGKEYVVQDGDVILFLHN